MEIEENNDFSIDRSRFITDQKEKKIALEQFFKLLDRKSFR